MRARNIKPGFWKNEELVEFDFGTRLLFVGLWMLADREGRLEDRPKRIKMELFPADNFDAKTAIDELEQAGLIERYEVKGKRLISIPNFAAHQSPHHSEKWSQLPDKNGMYTVYTKDGNGKWHPCKVSELRGSRETHGESTVDAPLEDGRNRSDTPNPDSLNPDSLNPDSPNPESTKASGDRQATAEQSKAKAAPKHTDEDRDVAERMLRQVREIAPSTKASKRWPDDIRLMRERDGHSHADILAMLDWVASDDFWRSNILCPAKLREKWPQLEAKRNAPPRRSPGGGGRQRQTGGIAEWLGDNGGQVLEAERVDQPFAAIGGGKR